MCGIVGYVGQKNPVPLLIESLRCLEYRGYDSSGIAILDDAQQLQIVKATGKLNNLVERLDNLLEETPTTMSEPAKIHLGMGHIRWATHGAATEPNAHPHVGANRHIAVVHNGIIENFYHLREMLKGEGRVFASETDTECVAQLVEMLWERHEDKSLAGFRTVMQNAIGQLQGAFALVIVNRQFPDHLFVVRRHAPLVVGHRLTDNDTPDEFFVASDTVAVIPHTNRILFLKDDEIAELSPQGVVLMDVDGRQLDPVITAVDASPLTIDKKGFRHFMLKEIHEQPDVIRNSLSGRLIHPEVSIELVAADDKQTADELLKSCNRMVVIGCGTSLNAGLVGKYFVEELVRLPMEVESAGEYRYRQPIITPETLIVAISQSGETADTLEAVRNAAKLGAKVLTITNRDDSTLARESDIVLPVRAGVEVSVCATKSFSAQVVVLYLLGIYLAELRNAADPQKLLDLKSELMRLPAQLDAYLNSDNEAMIDVAKRFSHAANMLFIARGINYPVALEGALKLKEISYIHAEGYSASELKHGPIAMLDEEMPVVSILTPGKVFDKMVSNCQEAKARDARMLAFSSATLDNNLAEMFEAVVPFPDTDELLTPLMSTVPLQLFAYYIAEHLGKDVDQPRNLAKSVTVE
jgi:glucosamine--fructose-6-phosphate aminotransferase (isomerizing)